MKAKTFFKRVSAILISQLILSGVMAFNAGAENAPDMINITPDHPFNEEIGAEVILTLDDGMYANVKIELDEVHIPPAIYYNANIAGAENKSHVFKLGGCDNGLDPKYTVTVTVPQYAGSSKVMSYELPPFSVMVEKYTTDFRYKVFNLNLHITEDHIDEPIVSEPIITSDGNTDIMTQTVTFYSMAIMMGDVTGDGKVDPSDASDVLSHYAAVSIGTTEGLLPLGFQKAADVNNDGTINPVDASIILTYYAIRQTGSTPDWAEII